MKSANALREIRESSDEELRTRLTRLEEELFGHRVKRFTNQLDNTMKIRQARREIARVQTILAARGRGLDQQAAKQAETDATAAAKPAAEPKKKISWKKPAAEAAETKVEE